MIQILLEHCKTILANCIIFLDVHVSLFTFVFNLYSYIAGFQTFELSDSHTFIFRFRLRTHSKKYKIVTPIQKSVFHFRILFILNPAKIKSIQSKDQMANILKTQLKYLFIMRARHSRQQWFLLSTTRATSARRYQETNATLCLGFQALSMSLFK